jgi:hypothetical protein
MGLRDIVSKIFSGSKPAQQTTAQSVTPSPSQAGNASIATLERFRGEMTRAEEIRTCRIMYRTDPRIKKAHRKYSQDMVKGGFVVKTSHAAALEAAKALQKRLNLNHLLEDFGRLSQRDGNSFIQLEINEQMQICSLTRKPTLRMRRNSNEVDRFENPQRAFCLVNDRFLGTTLPTEGGVWFAEWEMIHARWDHDEEERYGTPMFASAVQAYRRVSEGEMDMAVRRKVRAGIRLLHVIENGSLSDIETYKENNKEALNTPFAALLDYFSNKKGSIEVIQGDATLNQIDDVLHHIATMFAGSDIPMELVAYGDNLNRDVLGDKKDEYAETLEQGREWLTNEIIKPLLERQWLLAGILPESVTYEIIWRPHANITPAMVRDLADASMRLRVLGVKDELINALLARFLPGVEVDQLINMPDAQGGTQQFADMLKGLSI